MPKKISILFLLLLCSIPTIISQETIIYNKNVEFNVRIVIVDKNNSKVVNNVEINANGKTYSRPDINGKYIISAKVGDEIRVSHPDFETVYYTLKSNEDIRIVAEDFNAREISYSKMKRISKRKDLYLTYLDSAKFYKK